MNISGWTSALLVFVAINAVYFAPLKGSPPVSVLFILSVMFALLSAPLRGVMIRRARAAWVGCALYLIYVAVMYGINGGAGDVAFRILVNALFFLTATTYFSWLSKNGRDAGIRQVIIYALFTAVALSFVQTLVNVIAGHLWLLPLNVQDSTDAYAIQNAAPILFGDQNKNLWATKTLFTYLTLFSMRQARWKLFDIAALLMFLFTLVYLCSRTAQLAFVVGISGYLLFRYRSGFGFVRRIIVALLVCGLLGLSVVLMRISVTTIDLSAGNQGDGLLARLFLWNYFFTWLPSFGLREVCFGHGVFAVANFLSPPFEETNLHNVFLNQFYDFGLVGASLYCCFLWFVFKTLAVRWRWLLVPALFVVVNSQYLGHDPELLTLYAFSVLLATPAVKESQTSGPSAIIAATAT